MEICPLFYVPASIANNSKDFPMIFEIATKKFEKKE
jgi:hypothetical protein